MTEHVETGAPVAGMDDAARARNEVFDNDYIPYVVRIGRTTNTIGVLLSFAPAMTLFLVYGMLPPIGALVSAFLTCVGAFGALWFVEPISYFPVLGVSGTYMAFMTGNISNLRVPCASVAQKAAGVEPGTREGSVVATLGMAVSVVVNIIILTAGVLFGAYILANLPPVVDKALKSYVLPALFGALFMQFAISNKKIAVIGLVIGLVLARTIPRPFGYLATLCTVFGTVIISLWLYRKHLI